jgi:hypothetical protein
MPLDAAQHEMAILVVIMPHTGDYLEWCPACPGRGIDRVKASPLRQIELRTNSRKPWNSVSRYGLLSPNDIDHEQPMAVSKGIRLAGRSVVLQAKCTSPRQHLTHVNPGGRRFKDSFVSRHDGEP